MGLLRHVMAAVLIRRIVDISTSFICTSAVPTIRQARGLYGNARRYFSYAAMAEEFSSNFKQHFRFAAYNRIDRIKILDATAGKYGNVFGDNLMRNEDFRMHIYVNTTDEPLPSTDAKPDINRVPTDKFDDAICWVPKRDFITEFVHIVDVGSLCCGHKGVWHGGITSAIFDNAFGILGCSILRMAATKYLNIQFKAPIMVGDSVALVVSFDPQQLTGEKKDRFVAKGTMYNQNGTVVATGESELVDVWDRWQKKLKQSE
ncbi:uncharacterized protein BXIN_2137 [Babesia sp. Xinjiang]|uniref:uncharacterized protein n=1 Tax=Babesia sp. Xinjiang TaxID=462227 RepID=UPI000A24EA9C|nr:uncharacterized protein BXIN_2137 [Babesia sp. Xinjiang]ORM40530.1 hypothetical protein BXIN_2137 [Babesia sp. Xinjiang]